MILYGYEYMPHCWLVVTNRFLKHIFVYWKFLCSRDKIGGEYSIM